MARKSDPPQAERCAVCPKKLPPIALRDGDPFCSAECCRKWHGLAVTPGLKGKPPRKGTRTRDDFGDYDEAA